MAIPISTVASKSAFSTDILAVPVSIVASKSAFSTGGCILDPFQSSLSPTTVQALISSQNWLRSKVENDLRSLVDDIENIQADNKNITDFFCWLVTC